MPLSWAIWARLPFASGGVYFGGPDVAVSVTCAANLLALGGTVYFANTFGNGVEIIGGASGGQNGAPVFTALVLAEDIRCSLSSERNIAPRLFKAPLRFLVKITVTGAPALR